MPNLKENVLKLALDFATDSGDDAHRILQATVRIRLLKSFRKTMRALDVYELDKPIAKAIKLLKKGRHECQAAVNAANAAESRIEDAVANADPSPEAPAAAPTPAA